MEAVIEAAEGRADTDITLFMSFEVKRLARAIACSFSKKVVTASLILADE